MIISHKAIGFFLPGALLVLFAVFVGGRFPYFLLYAYLLALLIPLVHSLLGFVFIKGQVALPAAELVAGEEITLHYRVENPLSIPFPRLELENQLGYRLTGIKEGRKVFALQGKDWMDETSSLVCRRRGYYQTGSVKLYITDIFQFFTLTKVIATPIRLKVYPRVVTVDSFRLEASQQMGSLRVKNPLFQDYTELSDLRQYREGDPLKRIHWKLSASKDQLLVKHFEERGDTQVLMVLDSQRSHYQEDGERWVEDHLVEGAAALIHYCLHRNIYVNMTYLSHGKPVDHSGDTPLHMKHFLDGLALFQPEEGVDFETQIEISTQHVPHGTALFFLTPEITKRTAHLGINLRLKNHQPQFMVFGDKKTSPVLWQENRKMIERLKGEGIGGYLFERGTSIKEVLEGIHGKGT